MESRVRSKAILFFLILLLTAVPLSYSSAPPPVDCTHLLAWMVGGVSSTTLSRIIQQRGISFPMGPVVRRELQVAGGTPEFLNWLASSKPARTGAVCPATLVHAGELVQRKQFEAAGDIVRALLQHDSRNGALHFSLCYIMQQL